AMRSALLGAGADPDRAQAAAVRAAAAAPPPPAAATGTPPPPVSPVRPATPPPIPPAPFHGSHDHDHDHESAEDDSDGDPIATVESPPRRRSRRWMVVVVIVLLAAMAGAFALQGGEKTADPPTADTLSVVTAHSFDPQGDNGGEHEDQVLNALDQNPNTAWRTENYKDPEVMAGKDGVGLVLTLDGAQDIGQVDVRTTEGGWSAQVYAVDGDAPSDLAGWGEPLASVKGADAGLTRFELDGAHANQVLVWFTRVADTGDVAVSEVSVRAP
ncbi:MAG: hypothetical protein ACTHN0_04160, partial [Aquihabitans sp.]